MKKKKHKYKLWPTRIINRGPVFLLGGLITVGNYSVCQINKKKAKGAKMTEKERIAVSNIENLNAAISSLHSYECYNDKEEEMINNIIRGLTKTKDSIYSDLVIEKEKP